MKIIITEEQYNLISEQKPDNLMPGQIERFGYKQNDPKTWDSALKKQVEYFRSLDPHTSLLILELAVSITPVIGPFLAIGIGLADAALYYKEGDKKMAGLSAMFSLLPGAVGLFAKIPAIKKLGSKGMQILANKIAKNSKLNPTELVVANGIATNKELVKNELNLLTKEIAQKNITKSESMKKLAKSGLIFGGTIGFYHGIGSLYNYGYEKATGDIGIPKSINNIDISKISDVNKQAALNIKFD